MTKYLCGREVMRSTEVDIYMARVLQGKVICGQSQFFGVNLDSALVSTCYLFHKLEQVMNLHFLIY